MNSAHLPRIGGRLAPIALSALLGLGAIGVSAAPALAEFGVSVCGSSIGGGSDGVISATFDDCVSVTPITITITGPGGWSSTLFNGMVEWFGTAYDGTFTVPYLGSYTITWSGDAGASDGPAISSSTFYVSGKGSDPPLPQAPGSGGTGTGSGTGTGGGTGTGSGGGGTGTGTTNPAPDTTAPRITAHPATTNISRTAGLTVRFSEKVKGVVSSSKSIRLVDTTTGTTIAVRVRLSSDGRSVTVTPTHRLATKHRYTLRVGASIVDLAGNHLVAHAFTFRTRK